jgi:hypothetical protein
MTLDPQFAAGMRQQLIDTAAGTSPLARVARRNHLVLRGLVAVGAAASLTAGAVIVSGMPGSHVVTDLGSSVVESHVGTATVNLGVLPDEANAVSFAITCTSAGAFTVTFADGSGILWECSETPGLNERTTLDPYDSTVPVGYTAEVTGQLLGAAERSFVVETDPHTTWTISTTLASSVTVDWGVNAKGQTFGAPNEKGSPDLIPVRATNGAIGYALWADFISHGAEGDSFPVYESDGTTVIGEFRIGSD